MYKVWCVIVGVALFLPLWMHAQSSSDSDIRRLAALRDKSRPLLIFCLPGDGKRQPEDALKEQRKLFLGHEAELKDRDVVLLYLTSSMSTGLRKQFQVDERRFTVVLLGKDGKEKFRSHDPVTIEKLDALIDAMPMRQQEVRDGHHPE